MLAKLREYDDSATTKELWGTDVYDPTGDKVGAIKDALFDPDTGDIRYFLVDAGWLSTKRFLVPADALYVLGSSDRLLLPISKDEIATLPEFRDEFLQRPDEFREYEPIFRRKWPLAGRKGTESRLIARIRESVRDLRQPRSRAERTGVVETMPLRSAPASYVGAVTLYGLYQDRADLERAVSELKNLGFTNQDISVVFPDQRQAKRFAVEHATKAPEGALAGGSTGLVVGGILGWLAGIGSIAIPGIGPIIAAGPIVATITGAGVGSAVGGIAGALIGVGVPELEAKRYESEIKGGRMLIAVNCADIRFTDSARDVLTRTNAKDVYASGERRAA